MCQERVARHLAFCPTPAPVTIRYGILLVRTVVTGTTVEVSPRASQRGLSPRPVSGRFIYLAHSLTEAVAAGA